MTKGAQGHPHPDLAGPGFGELLLHHLQHLRPATPLHHDAMVAMADLGHGGSFDLGAPRGCEGQRLPVAATEQPIKPIVGHVRRCHQQAPAASPAPATWPQRRDQATDTWPRQRCSPHRTPG
jgi:hypothetical protein